MIMIEIVYYQKMNHNNCMMDKKIYIYYVIYYLILIISSIYSYIYKIGEIYFIPIGFIACLFLPFLFKIFHLKMIIEFHLLNLIFVTCSIVLGSILNLYAWHYYDKILHFSSGFLFCESAYILYQYLTIRYQSKDIQILCLLFMNAFNMMIAVFWEFYEYACLLFLNNDAIHHYSSGVHDAMGDMIVALCGGLVVTFGVIRYYKTKKKNILIHICGKFIQMNV